MIQGNKKERKKLFKGIREKKRKKRMPFSIMYELTYRCNFRCPHCYLGSQNQIKKKELSTNKVKKVLDELEAIGVYRIGFTGGEPLLRKDIFEILDYANKKGFRFGLLTNAALINASVADKIKRANVDKVDITFNSLNEDTFAQLSGVKGAYKKVRKAIELLLKRNIQVTIKSTATRLNQDQLLAISKFARKRNMSYRTDGEVLPCRDGCGAWVEDFSVDAETIYKIRRQVHPEMFEPKKGKKRKKSRTKRRRDRVFNCGVGRTAFSVTPQGKMNFCIEIDYPSCDLLADGAAACWERIKEEVDRINKLGAEGGFICKDCQLLPFCGWCAGRSFLETGSFNQCSQYFKQRAIARRKIRRRQRKKNDHKE